MSVGEAALTLTERIIGSIPIPRAHLIQFGLDTLKTMATHGVRCLLSNDLLSKTF